MCFVYCCLLTVHKALASKQVLKKYWLSDEVVMKLSLQYSRNLAFQLLCPLCAGPWESARASQSWVCSSVTWGQ